MPVIVSNFATAKLASPIGTGETQITLESSSGSVFPLPGAEEWFPVVLTSLDGSGKIIKREIVRCTARSDDILTVERGFDGTYPETFGVGDIAGLYHVRAVHDEFMQSGKNLSELADKEAAFNAIKQSATTEETGVVELSTDTEAKSKSGAKAITAGNLAALDATTERSGMVEKSTSPENIGGTATDKFPDVAGVKEVVDTFALRKTQNLADLSDKAAAFSAIKQAATTASAGVVEKATTTEAETGAADKFPDAAGTKAAIDAQSLRQAQNLADVANPAIARGNIGASSLPVRSEVWSGAATSLDLDSLGGGHPGDGLYLVIYDSGKHATWYEVQDQACHSAALARVFDTAGLGVHAIDSSALNVVTVTDRTTDGTSNGETALTMTAIYRIG